MNKNLVFINDVPKKFKKDEEYIKERIETIFNLFEFDCRIKLNFVDSIDVNEYEQTDCALINKSVKRHELLITNSVLNSINFDGGRAFCLAIYHEFEHIKDFNNVMKTNLFDFKLCLTHQKNFKNQYISVGYFFWTEIYAYYKTIKFAEYNNLKFEKITFGRLVKNYIKTIECNKNFYYKQDLCYEEAEKYIKMVDSFVYLCAKYMSSAYASHSRVPYSRIEKNKQYKKVFLLLKKIEPKVSTLSKNIYGAKSYEKLFKLGKMICEDIRWKVFKVGLVKKSGRTYSFY